MYIKKLKLKVKQQQEHIDTLDKLIENKDSVKVEKELVKKNADLLAQLERTKKQIIMMKVNGQKEGQKKNPLSNSLRKSVTPFTIDLDIKKTNLQQEL